MKLFAPVTSHCKISRVPPCGATGGAHRNGVNWRLFPHLLVIAFLLRATFALTTYIKTNPDEMFQYLEQAHRLVFGYGVVPWEYQYGTRSWIIPGFVALILKSLAAFGVDRPDIYQPTVRLVFCAISLSLPWSVYRITQAILDEGTARLALTLAAFWPLLVIFSPTPMPDALAAYTFLAALVWLFDRPTHASALAFGALSGLTLALRFQLALMIGTAMLIAAWRWRYRAWPAVVGFVPVIALAGALDAYTWGRWFSSIVSNIELNWVAGVAAAFGDALPGYFYLLSLFKSSAGAAYFGAFGLVFSWRKTWPLSLMGMLQLAAFSAISHKEGRFILPLVPIYLIGLAAFLSGPGQRLRTLTMRFAAYMPFGPRIVAALVVLVFVIGMVAKIPRDDIHQFYLPWARHNDIHQAYLMLSRRTDVRGVIDDSGESDGYYDLHQAAPIYRQDWPATKLALVRQLPTLFASHWLTPAGVGAPKGFELLAQSNSVTIWHRSKEPPETLMPPGYSPQGPIPFDYGKMPPKVIPRW